MSDPQTAASEVRIDIKTVGDPSGVQKVTQALGQIPAAGAASSESIKNAGAVAQRAAGAMGQMVGATQSMGPASRALLGSTQVLAQGMQALTAGVGGLITILVTLAATITSLVVTAWQKKMAAIQAATDKAVKHAEAVKELNKEKLEAIGEQYDQLRSKADAAASAADRLRQATDALRDAREAAALAELEAQEKQAMLGVDPADAAASGAVRDRFAEERAGIKARFGAERADSRAAGAASEVARIEGSVKTKDAEIAALQQRLAELEAAQVSLMVEGQTNGIGPAHGARSKALRESIGAAQAGLSSATEARGSLSQELDAARIRAQAAGIGRGTAASQAAAEAADVTAGKQFTAAAVAAQTSAAAALAATVAKLAAKEQEAQALAQQLAAAQAAAQTQTDEAFSARRAVGASGGRFTRRNGRVETDESIAAREEQEARDAAAAFGQTKGQLSALLQTLITEINTLQAEVKSQRSRAQTSRMDLSAEG